MNIDKDAAVAVPEDLAHVQETGSEYTTSSDGDENGSEYRTEDNSEDKKEDNKGHISTYDIKFGRAFPRLLLLITCLSFIITLLLTVDRQLFINIQYTTKLYTDTADMNAQTTETSMERLLYDQLNTVISLPLARNSTESNEQCLVRGLHMAQASLSAGLGFRYRDIRDSVVDWAEAHCFQEPPRLEQQVADIVSRHQTALGKLMEYFEKLKQMDLVPKTTKLASLACVFEMLIPVHSELGDLAEHNSTDAPDAANVVPNVPFGFKFICEDGRPCSLTYPADSDQPTPEANSTSTATPPYHLHARKAMLATLTKCLKVTRWTTIIFEGLTMWFQIALCVLLALFTPFAYRTVIEHRVANLPKCIIAIVMLMRQSVTSLKYARYLHSAKPLVPFDFTEHVLLVAAYVIWVDGAQTPTQLIIELWDILFSPVNDDTDAPADAPTVGKMVSRELQQCQVMNQQVTYDTVMKRSEERETQYMYDSHCDAQTETATESGSEDEYMVGSDTVDLAGGLTTLDTCEVDGWTVL